VLLVSHDRHFMDSVVTSLLVMPGGGKIEEQAGSYSDWEARGGRIAESSLTKHSPSQTPSNRVRQSGKAHPDCVDSGNREKTKTQLSGAARA
jgi:ATP-binding cassette subfamily F protein uup